MNNRKNFIASRAELFTYLDDIVEYVNSIILYHNGYNCLDLDEILSYLSTIEDLVDNIKLFLKKENQ